MSGIVTVPDGRQDGGRLRWHPERATARVVGAAGTAYLGAWLVGLAIAPAGPDAFAPAAEVYSQLAAHRHSALAQSVLVHGVAGVALGVWAIASHRVARPVPRRVTVASCAGVAAGVLSLVQVALQLWAQHQLDLASVDGVDGAWDAINRVDAAKLVALAVLVAGYSAPVGRACERRGAVTAFGLLTAALLALGGASFLIDLPALAGVLYASLPLLLVWVGVVTTVLARRGRRR
ncbi:MAG TPA: hypothetical protein VD864_12480 [Nocardioides sp.]|nr:hypothetical protein [Nocardioides sp.]